MSGPSWLPSSSGSSDSIADEITLRDEPRASDAVAIRRIVASTGFFHDFEVDVAVELVEERLAKGLASEYYFLFADRGTTKHEAGESIGYACFGPIACTVGSFDLYWVAVRADRQGHGLGARLMQEAERRMAAGLIGPGGTPLAPGRRVYVETSSRDLYAPTRAFYARCGYAEEARLRDFYAVGDDKVVYVKAIG
ncbi:MAG: N-acetyltransferase family protein [Phycisphaerales bacterium]